MSTDIVPAGMYDGTGLEDLGDSLAVPRLRLKHADGVFQDPDTNEEFAQIFAVVLGLVKQRVLFDVAVATGDKPMCKSPNTEIGYPNLIADNPRKRFPWNASGFDPSSAPADEDGRIFLGCQSCKLKDWDAHPLTHDKPWCSEQFTLPIMYAPTEEQLRAYDLAPALVTFQKTGLGPARKYLKTFQARKMGAYTALTSIRLTTQSTGQVVYSTPIFSKLGDSDQTQWADWADQYAQIRHFLTNMKPPLPEQPEATAQPVAHPVTTPVQGQSAMSRPPLQPQAAPANVVPASVPPMAPSVSDDDLPF